MLWLRLGLIFLVALVPIAEAQAPQCDKSAAITVTVANTTTIIPAIPGLQIDVCGFVITGDTNGTRATFNSLSSGGTTTAKTGAMVINAGIPMVSPGDFAFQVPSGAAVTLTAGTGSITGLIVFRQ